jgi:hypothetical protein
VVECFEFPPKTKPQAGVDSLAPDECEQQPPPEVALLGYPQEIALAAQYRDGIVLFSGSAPFPLLTTLATW